MNLSEIIDTSGIIERAFEQAAMKIKPRSAKRPDIDTALRAVGNQIEKECALAVYEQVAEALEKEYIDYCQTYGEWADQPDKEQWGAMVDEMVETAIKPWQPVLSQDWLGRMTIGTGLHTKDGLEIFSRSLGKEYYKQLVHGKTPVQVMSSAGVMRKDVEALLALHLKPTEKENDNMSEETQTTELQAIIEKMALHLGKDPDNVMGIYDDIGMVADDDDILSAGAAPRLGLEEEDIETLRMESLTYGADLADVILKGMEVFHESGKKGKGRAKAASAAPKEPKAPKPSKKAAKTLTADESEGTIPPSVLAVLKTCGVKDEEMGKKLGVSRATYNGYATGKVVLEPDENQLSAVRGELVDRANALLESIALLDGSEPHVVF